MKQRRGPDDVSGVELPTETERLLLRRLSLADLDFVAEMLADPEVMEFWPRPYTREEAAGWIRRQQGRYEEDGHGYWLAVRRGEDMPVGQIGVLRVEVDGAPESALGYMIHRPYWRRGYATEGAAACRDWALEALRRPRVVTLVRPGNLASLGVARKLGMEEVGRTMHAGLEHLVLAVTGGC